MVGQQRGAKKVRPEGACGGTSGGDKSSLKKSQKKRKPERKPRPEAEQKRIDELGEDGEAILVDGSSSEVVTLSSLDGDHDAQETTKEEQAEAEDENEVDDEDVGPKRRQQKVQVKSSILSISFICLFSPLAFMIM